MSRRMMLLVNPNAGRSSYKSCLGEVLQAFCASGIEPTVFFTAGPGEAPRLIAENAGRFDFVSCMGGDGTLSEVINGLMVSDPSIPIGYIPLGTTNDVARTLGISTRPVLAAKAIAAGSPMPFDVGEFGRGKYFSYVAAFGAFTEVSYATPQEYKRALGHTAYMLEAMKTLTKLPHYNAIVEYDDGVLMDDFIFGAVTNSASVAGLIQLDKKSVNLSDGLFEVLLVKTPKDLLDLNEIVTSILLGDFTGESVRLLKTTEVRIMFREPAAWTRDGEDGGSHRDVMIFNRHPGVQIIV